MKVNKQFKTFFYKCRFLIIVISTLWYSLSSFAFTVTDPANTWRHTQLIKKLERMGIQVIEVGDVNQLVIPLDRIYYADSSRLLPQAKEPLDTIADYLLEFRKIEVSVDAFSDTNLPQRETLALTQQQAQYVAQYLWVKGIDARLLGAKGHGPFDTIASNKDSRGQELNRHLEINFRQIGP